MKTSHTDSWNTIMSLFEMVMKRLIMLKKISMRYSCSNQEKISLTEIEEEARSQAGLEIAAKVSE